MNWKVIVSIVSVVACVMVWGCSESVVQPGDTKTFKPHNPFAEKYTQRRVVLKVQDGWILYRADFSDGTSFNTSMTVSDWRLLKGDKQKEIAQ